MTTIYDADREYLNLLSIFHYVVGGLHALLALIPVFHILMGLAFVFLPCEAPQGGCPPPFFGWFFVLMGALFVLLGEIFAVAVIVNGRFLARRQHYKVCIVLAALECLLLPFGTILGVFTLIVLNRPSVRALFGVSSSPDSAAPAQAAGIPADSEHP